MPESRELNIVFNGTFIFHRTKELPVLDESGNIDKSKPVRRGYAVLVPNVPGHVYRAGNWLGEVDFLHIASRGLHNASNGPAFFELKGVKDGTARLDPSKNLILRTCDIPDFSKLQDVHAVLFLPLPRSIASPRPLIIEKELIDPQALDEIQTAKKETVEAKPEFTAGTLQIFTYAIEDETELRIGGSLGGMTWEPAFVNGATNLHIIAAPEHHRFHQHMQHGASGEPAHSGGVIHAEAEATPDGVHKQHGAGGEHAHSGGVTQAEAEPTPGGVHNHVRVSFQKCMEIMKSNVRLNGDRTLRVAVLNQDEMPKNVLPEEAEGLDSRTLRLALLGRMAKSGRDLNLLWFDTEALGEDPGACACPGCPC